MPYIPKCGQRNANGIGVGIKYPNSTVIKTAQFGEWPSICAILNQTYNGEERFVSGASLIAENVVLTVAHYLRYVLLKYLPYLVSDSLHYVHTSYFRFSKSNC